MLIKILFEFTRFFRLQNVLIIIIIIIIIRILSARGGGGGAFLWVERISGNLRYLIFTFTRYITNQFNDQLPVGLLV